MSGRARAKLWIDGFLLNSSLSKDVCLSIRVKLRIFLTVIPKEFLLNKQPILFNRVDEIFRLSASDQIAVTLISLGHHTRVLSLFVRLLWPFFQHSTSLCYYYPDPHPISTQFRSAQVMFHRHKKDTLGKAAVLGPSCCYCLLSILNQQFVC